MIKISRLIIPFLPLLLGFQSSTSHGSTCFGSSQKGRIEDAAPLPSRGENFQIYSSVGVLLRRNFVHDKVRDVIVEAYRTLENKVPDQTFVYGESGWPSGGAFPPHKTHQNGLSVDFMVPVVDKNGRAAPFPGSIFNKFGYGLEFDAEGRMDGLRIDFNAIAAHLKALDDAAKKHGIGIRRVIFDLPYHRLVRATTAWKPLSFGFHPRQVWIRHDEHYHVDFQVPCRAE